MGEKGEVKLRSKKSFKKRLKPNQTEQTARQVETREDIIHKFNL